MMQGHSNGEAILVARRGGTDFAIGVRGSCYFELWEPRPRAGTLSLGEPCAVSLEPLR